MSRSTKNQNVSIQKEIEQLTAEKRLVAKRLENATLPGAKLFLEHLHNYCEEKIYELLEAQLHTQP